MNEIASPLELCSPNQITSDMLEALMHQTIETGRCLQFDVEAINQREANVVPIFRVRFGHFGFKVNRLNPKVIRYFPHSWGQKGRGVDIESFHKGWGELTGTVSINNLTIKSLTPFVYARPNLSDEPMVYDKNTLREWNSVLVVRHPSAFREVVPILHTDEGAKLGRWYSVGPSECPQWKIEWVSVAQSVLQQHSREEILRECHMPVYPLQSDQELVSEFLSASETYMPFHCASVLTATQLRQQLYDTLWCMETHHRVVPRYTKRRLAQWVNRLRIECTHCIGPHLETAMTTTEIVQLYAQRGNPIVRNLLHRSFASTFYIDNPINGGHHV